MGPRGQTIKSWRQKFFLEHYRGLIFLILPRELNLNGIALIIPIGYNIFYVFITK